MLNQIEWNISTDVIFVILMKNFRFVENINNLPVLFCNSKEVTGV